MQLDRYFYIGFAANNAICNDNFFSGSITLYPTGERGNIWYSDQYISDTSSEEFKKNYKDYILSNLKKLDDGNSHNHFICFNKKIKDICSDIKEYDIIMDKNEALSKLLNDKFYSREFAKKYVSILKYEFSNDGSNYDDFVKKFGSTLLVYQAKIGAGGANTLLIQSKEDSNSLESDEYSVSRYIKNTPLNITVIISDDGIILFPISAQLIRITDKCFKYVGADFEYANNLSDSIKTNITDVTLQICNELKLMNYRGILGIDYVLIDGKLFFMEFNPRFQSSSFLINLELTRNKYPCLAELHYKAIANKKIKYNNFDIKIRSSFLNCNSKNEFSSVQNYNILKNGYFPDNPNSIYRKIYNRSIIFEDSFEHE